MYTIKWKFQDRFISLWIFLIIWKTVVLLPIVTAISNKILNLRGKKKKSCLVKKWRIKRGRKLNQSCNVNQTYGGQGQCPLHQHCYPVTTNKAYYKYELKDTMQKAYQKESRGRFIAFNYFCLKVSSGAQAHNILYFPLPGANVKHTWKTHFMLITY